MKRWLVILAMVGFITVSSVIFVYLLFGQKSEHKQNRSQPETPISATRTFTFTALPTATVTNSPTPTATITPSPTATMTLATRVAIASIIMPEVTLPPSTTPLPENLKILAAAPPLVEPLLNATLLPFPYTDFTNWVSFESDHPAMRYIEGTWTPIDSLQASQGQYHFTEETNAKLSFTFTGEAVRVRYVAFTNGGVWNVLLDGMIVDVIDSYAPIGTFTGTQVYTVGKGEHTLELDNTDTANAASSGHMLAFDAVQVYRPDALTLILPNGVLPTDTPTATLVSASKVEIIAAPPSPQPTLTEIPIQTVNASIVIGYDENANGTLDVSEGVRGISVRLVEEETNNVLAHAFTDEQGFAQLQAATNSVVQLVVPYFGQSWTVQSNHAGSGQSFTLLLSPGNQPGLIP